MVSEKKRRKYCKSRKWSGSIKKVVDEEQSEKMEDDGNEKGMERGKR